MARVIKVVKAVRNNWKKSLIATGAVSYGINYANEKYKINNLMRQYCAEASTYGNAPQPAHQRFGKILVILNPIADRRSSTNSFDEFCAPILHLGGLAIDVVKTDSEGHARRYVEELETLPDAILCAGGDGTLSEIVTGLLRRSNKNESYPTIGILPVGRTNTVGVNIFDFTTDSKLAKVKGIADASISIVRGKTAKKDVMKVELMEENVERPIVKPVYAVGTIEWGAFRDAFNLRDRYWYFGPLRDHTAFLFNAFSDNLTWKCSATLSYTEPCFGCNNCYVKPQQREAKEQNRRWWSGFIPSFRLGSSQSNRSATADYSKIVNENCLKVKHTQIQSTGLTMLTSNVINDNEESAPKLTIKLSKDFYGFEFLWESWKRLTSKQIDSAAEYLVRTVEILPETNENVDGDVTEHFFSIDQESYEVKPIRVTLLPKCIDFYVL